MDVGISDHSKGYLACLAALVKGATFFEKHITFSNKMYGSDAINALEPNEFKQLSKNLNDLQIIISAKINKNNISEYKSMRKIFQKVYIIIKIFQKEKKYLLVICLSKTRLRNICI